VNSETQIQKFIGRLALAFPGGGKLSEELGKEYFLELKLELTDIDLDVLKGKLKRENEFFPSIKKILDAAAAIKAVRGPREFTGGPSPTTKEHISGQEYFDSIGVKDFNDLLKKRGTS